MSSTFKMAFTPPDNYAHHFSTKANSFSGSSQQNDSALLTRQKWHGGNLGEERARVKPSQETGAMMKSLDFLARRAPPAVHLFIVLLALAPAYHGVDLSQCIAPLGMESGAIPDADINASSSFDTGNVGPHLARLKSENLGGAWCPKDQITKEAREWLEIDLHSIHLITATATQGRFGNGVGVEYAEAYLLEYWRPRLGKWVRYRDIKGEES
ncbi:discoidin domain-containing receptor 2-like protein [Lasius niger]|uniref:Discoidin domain-containing receptor 2-like protein n=1 Tax=Lasius niger TaxID=67767 RepID=A0A0J7L8Z2_LASNI|nr:discoidin domain-containing receptor 2-like protein [Lasius niger]